MNIQAEKIALAKMVLDTDNPTILKSIKNILTKKEDSDFWDGLSLEQQKEIKEASLEIEEGETTDYELFISKHR